MMPSWIRNIVYRARERGKILHDEKSLNRHRRRVAMKFRGGAPRGERRGGRGTLPLPSLLSRARGGRGVGGGTAFIIHTRRVFGGKFSFEK